MKITNASKKFFIKIIFYKNRIFTKKNFLLNHTSWGYFLDYMNLPYQFWILRMSTFCCYQWFLSKLIIILVVYTNMCPLFFYSDLTYFEFFSCEWNFFHEGLWYSKHLGISIRILQSFLRLRVSCIVVWWILRVSIDCVKDLWMVFISDIHNPPCGPEKCSLNLKMALL